MWKTITKMQEGIKIKNIFQIIITNILLLMFSRKLALYANPTLPLKRTLLKPELILFFIWE